MIGTSRLLKRSLLAAATIAGLALGSASPTFAHGSGQNYGGWGGGYGMGPGMMGPDYGYGMGPGMMGPGMMGPGMMGPGMMGPGCNYGMGPGMMGPGMMGPGMMGPGYGHGMGPGMMGRGYDSQQANLNLTTSDVKAYLDRHLAMMGNPHIKAGPVTEKDANTIAAEIVTADKSALVQRFNVDRRTGFWQPAQ